MISILIPTYNYICVDLVAELSRQAEQLKSRKQEHFEYEIMVADDGSPQQETILANRRIQTLPHCRFIERDTNVGRAFIRNWMIEQSHFPYLLIIDSDAGVCTPDFIECYWNMRHEADVICGTIRNPHLPCPPQHELRYRYERQAEKRRQKTDINANPYMHLSTFNLFINKERLGNLRFDTRCKEYGYEDALMGLSMQQRHISILHLPNPLIHYGIDSNISFLSKTEAAMRTLSRLTGVMQEHAGTSRTYQRLARYRLIPLFALFFRLTQQLMRRNLLGRHPSIFIFQLYKLGYYTHINRQP